MFVRVVVVVLVVVVVVVAVFVIVSVAVVEVVVVVVVGAVVVVVLVISAPVPDQQAITESYFAVALVWVTVKPAVVEPRPLDHDILAPTPKKLTVPPPEFTTGEKGSS